MTVGAPLLEVRDLRKHFAIGGLLSRKRRVVRAVDGVSFSIARGEVLSLVGESGSGKTTVGRAVMRLSEPTGGEIRFRGQDITHLSRAALRPARRHMQLVFQDPFSSLNPRKTVEAILATPLLVHGVARSRDERRARVEAALLRVGLFAAAADRYPHEFSGGQRQRIGIARALMLDPELLVADEPVSALDVSVQAQVVNLLLDLRDELRLSMLFIAHDLALVGAISDRVAVLYLGRLVEIAPTTALFSGPRHPYTEALFSSVPDPDRSGGGRRIILQGDLPSPMAPPSGCAFRNRCPYALSSCAEGVPELRERGPGHFAACIRDDLALAAPLENLQLAEIER